METENRLFSRQVEMLYQQAGIAALASAAAALLVAVALAHAAPPVLLLSWLASTAVAAWLHWQIHGRRKRAADAERNAASWANAFAASAALSGLCWGLCPVLFSPYVPFEYQLMMAVLALGISAAALPMISVLPKVYRAFVVCMAAPMLAWGALADVAASRALTVMTAAFLVLMLLTSARLAQALRSALRVQFNNEKLVASLQEEVAIRIAAEQAALRDLSDQRAAEDKVRYLAQHDGLTGLPNRSQLLESLRQSLSLAQRRRFKLGLLMFGLDRFKGINDSLGHAAGDSLICAVAERLKQHLRTEDFIARPGSDEFLVVLPYVKDSQDLARAALKLQRCFEMPFAIEQQEMYLTPSIGIGTFPDDGDTPEQLILRAETAMHQAKKAGGNGFAFYAAEMSALARENLNLENQLRHAIDNGEFLLHYQPQLDLQSNAIVGVEALIRWNRPGHGMVAPLKFIPVAEMSGLIVPIGEWVMQEACRQAQDWQKRGAEPIGVAVNVSARQFKDPELITKIAQCLESSGLDPHLLELELTESIVMEDPLNSAARLSRIRDLGVTISIDDFGTGYSSLSYLRQFPIDILKIDRSFVRDVHLDTHNAAIVTAILAMARQLQIGVVAEGIETAAQQSFLAKHGCGIGQGYYFSKPLPPDDCEKLFGRRPARALAFNVVK